MMIGKLWSSGKKAEISLKKSERSESFTMKVFTDHGDVVIPNISMDELVRMREIIDKMIE